MNTPTESAALRFAQGPRMNALTLVQEQPRETGARLEIDLGAIAANTQLFARRSSADVMAVVKADGFGHGAVDVARTALANGASSLGVTGIEEGVRLREAGLRAPVLSWLNPVDADVESAIRQGIDLAVPSRPHLEAVITQAAAMRMTAQIHLHLDTGMARDGSEPSAWPGLCRAARLAERSGTVQVVGVMGHLGCADHPSDPCNATGRTRFAWGVEAARSAGLRPAIRHLAATSATLTDPRTHHDVCRVGAGLVGIDPSRTVALRPAMTLTAPFVSVRRVRAGTNVGYAHTWTARAVTHLGLLPLGYADGLPRAASGRAEVLVRGRRRPIVGRISMDQVVVALGDNRVEPGEIATVFGPGDAGEPTVADWASWADTIEHEIVTGIGSRVHRHTRAAHAGALRSLS
ncbi:alanine racemase [Nocardioides sp.]|uniref:alanine racemase n=1 Tax=Nocardioides sp. TaxID=35761 RepID=UPI0031FE8384|nr:alanine racemase [Nocardioides sp.]